MKGQGALLLALLLLSGCAGLNDALVRSWLQDRELGNRINSQIREGLKRRMTAPAPVSPGRPAPPFLDRG